MNKITQGDLVKVVRSYYFQQKIGDICLILEYRQYQCEYVLYNFRTKAITISMDRFLEKIS